MTEDSGVPRKSAGQLDDQCALPGSARLRDFSKLRIEDGALHYRIQQQDGSMQAMTCRDTPSNRLFVSWVQVHDGFIPRAPVAQSDRAPDSGSGGSPFESGRARQPLSHRES